MKKTLGLVLNILIVIFTIVGVIIMISRSGGGMLSSSGWKNLKYFTVLSNIFCGIVAAVYLAMSFVKRNSDSFPGKVMTAVKLMAAAAVAVTFLMIAGFFGPLYGWSNLYHGSNFWFHLVIPVLAMIEFCFLPGKVEFKATFAAVIPAIVYGTFYLANNLINGTGEWPDTNDWYGFLNWGLPVGLVIFAGVALISWGVACGLRAISLKAGKNVIS